LRKRRPRGRQVWAKKANVSKPPRKCRKRSDDVKTGVESLLRDQPGGYLPTDQVASGIKAARTWLRLLRGTCEPVTSMLGLTGSSVSNRESLKQQKLQEAEYLTRGAGTDRLVVAMKPGNAGRAKGAGCPGLLIGQPQGRSR